MKQAGADMLGSYFTFENDLGIFARQLRQLGVTMPWVGSPSIVNVTALKLAGPALYSTYGVADYAEDSSPEARRRSRDAYRAACKVDPDNQSSWSLRRRDRAGGGHQQGRQDRPAGRARGHAGDQGLHGRRGRVQFRPERRRPARLQHRAERRAATSSSTSTSNSTTDVPRLRRPPPRGRRPRLRLLVGVPGTSMDLALQLLFTGIGIGAVYALVALGFVLIFRATNVVNFAQGEFSMVGGLSDGGVRRRSGLALLAVVPARARRHGAARRDLQSRRLLSAAPPHLPAGDHRHHRRVDPAGQHACWRSTARSRRCCRAGSRRPAFSSGRSTSTASTC